MIEENQDSGSIQESNSGGATTETAGALETININVNLTPAPEVPAPAPEAESKEIPENEKIEDVAKFAEAIEKSFANPFYVTKSQLAQLKAAGLAEGVGTIIRLKTGRTLSTL